MVLVELYRTSDRYFIINVSIVKNDLKRKSQNTFLPVSSGLKGKAMGFLTLTPIHRIVFYRLYMVILKKIFSIKHLIIEKRNLIKTEHYDIDIRYYIFFLEVQQTL